MEHPKHVDAMVTTKLHNKKLLGDVNTNIIMYIHSAIATSQIN